MGSPKVNGDTIESLINERKETEKEVRQLQKEIERVGAEKASAGSDKFAELDEEINRLTQLKKEKSYKLTEICRVARTISAGD